MDEAKPIRRARNLQRWVTVADFAALAYGGGTAGYFGRVPANGIRVDKLEADALQKIPRGSTRDTVKAGYNTCGVSEFRDLRNAGGQVDGYTGTVANDTEFELAEIHKIYRLDRDGLLTAASVYRSRADR